MGKVLRPILLGIGIGLLIAPMPGQEMRRLLMERFQQLRGSLPGSGQMDQYRQSLSGSMAGEERALKKVAEASPTEPHPSAYPEYVNPELNPKP